MLRGRTPPHLFLPLGFLQEVFHCIHRLLEALPFIYLDHLLFVGVVGLQLFYFDPGTGQAHGKSAQIHDGEGNAKSAWEGTQQSILTGPQFQRISQNDIFCPWASSGPWEGLRPKINKSHWLNIWFTNIQMYSSLKQPLARPYLPWPWWVSTKLPPERRVQHLDLCPLSFIVHRPSTTCCMTSGSDVGPTLWPKMTGYSPFNIKGQDVMRMCTNIYLSALHCFTITV